jgi:hypothetical protein
VQVGNPACTRRPVEILTAIAVKKGQHSTEHGTRDNAQLPRSEGFPTGLADFPQLEAVSARRVASSVLEGCKPPALPYRLPSALWRYRALSPGAMNHPDDRTARHSPKVVVSLTEL